jgi:hypothetical protein
VIPVNAGNSWMRFPSWKTSEGTSIEIMYVWTKNTGFCGHKRPPLPIHYIFWTFGHGLKCVKWVFLGVKWETKIPHLGSKTTTEENIFTTKTISG